MVELGLAFLGLWALLVFAPDAPFTHLLRHAMVELPIRGLAKVGRGHVITVALIAAAIALLDKELVLAISMSPEAIAWLATIEVGTLVDAVIGIILVATSVRFPRVSTFLRSLRPRARTTRARRPQRPTPSNDDEGGAGYLRAA
ncbi:MAG: hypothetical protein KF730_16075 [Sphingomonas sp.]|uniref:hypothetical protein n=1 Tax=Sphingomonas sp. TaxID=28214 RepID=UPI0025ED3CFE|nr:hypothetical protein [Sphingomonas sp.]MBX3566078.1 hypothetical protein [Sphingomonas sp.]